MSTLPLIEVNSKHIGYLNKVDSVMVVNVD